MAPLRKNFYKPSASVLARTRAEIDSFHRKHEITVRGQDAVQPIFEFNECGFPSYITTELAHQVNDNTPLFGRISLLTLLSSVEFSHLTKYLISKINIQGFKQPTVIQSQSWPIAMAGRDLVGIAQTGSGKSCSKLGEHINI